jgi:hypothetical protein
MIEEATRRLPTMVVVGVMLFLGFLSIALATILSVASDDTPEPATVAVLELSTDLEVVDAHQTCSAVACDGEGAVLLSEGHSAMIAVAMVAEDLRRGGWWQHFCGDDEPCLRRNDLGVEVLPWVAVHDERATAAMRANLESMKVDQESLVYVHVFRCDVVTPCRAATTPQGSVQRLPEDSGGDAVPGQSSNPGR